MVSGVLRRSSSILHGNHLQGTVSISQACRVQPLQTEVGRFLLIGTGETSSAGKEDSGDFEGSGSLIPPGSSHVSSPQHTVSWSSYFTGRRPARLGAQFLVNQDEIGHVVVRNLDLAAGDKRLSSGHTGKLFMITYEIIYDYEVIF